MVTDETFECGFIKDEGNLRFKKVFANNKKLKEMYIDIYPDNPLKTSNPFKLLIRTIENDVTISNDKNRLVLRKNDRFKTYIMNILLSDIKECFVEAVDKHYFGFIINVQNIYYKITVLN